MSTPDGQDPGHTPYVPEWSQPVAPEPTQPDPATPPPDSAPPAWPSPPPYGAPNPPAYPPAAPPYPPPVPPAAPAYPPPAPTYQPPAPTYTPPSYTAPTPAYEPPAPTYQAPAPAYEAPAPTYQAPAPAYEAPAPTYQAPAPAYEAPAQAPAYQPGNAAVPEVPAAPAAPAAPFPPTYDATVVAQQYSAQPYSSQPYSSQPYPGQPFPGQVSGPYGYGVPMMSAIPAPPPVKRSRTGIIILSIATALFLAATGVLGTLFVIRNNDANDLANQVTQLSAESTANKNKADGLQKDLDSTKRDLTDSKAQSDQLTQQRSVLAACINAILDETKAFNDAGGKITADVQAKEADTDAKCSKAQSLL